MDVYRNLPAPARIAIPFAAVLIVALMAYMTMFKPAPPVELVKTNDISVVDASKTLLDRKGYTYSEAQAGGSFSLSVPEAQATAAAQLLASNGIKDRTGRAGEIKCPAAPGFTGTKAANEKYVNCEAAKEVQGMLLTAGVTAAGVIVSKEATGDFLGPDKATNVVAMIFLPPYMKDSWDAEQAARAISKSVGTSIDRVSIMDDKLQTLFDGSEGVAKAKAAGSTSALGCDDMEAAREVETKKAAVRNCYETTIGAKLTELLGGSERFVLAVEPTIETAASTTTTTRNTKGPVVDSNSQKSGSSSTTSQEMPPNTTETNSVKPAGSIKSMRITVSLDQASVDASQVTAVKQLLSPYVVASRNDPAPVVTLTKFTAGAGDTAKGSELDKIREDAQAGSQPQQAMSGGGPSAPQPTMPTWAKAAMAALVVGIIGAVLVLWRRSAAIAAERQRMEASFANEQRLFENFAEQNPDDLAAEMAALFGQPAPQQPTYG